MRKSLFFVLITMVTTTFAQGITWQAKAGVNMSNMYTSGDRLDTKAGFKIGGGFEYAFNRTWGIQPSLYVTTKGAQKSEKEYGEKAVMKIAPVYLELPVLLNARVPVSKQTNLLFGAGPYVAYGISSKMSMGVRGYSFSFDLFDKGLFKRLDAGLASGITIEVKQWLFGIDGQLGLTNLVKSTLIEEEDFEMDTTDGGTIKNMNLSITFGYKF